VRAQSSAHLIQLPDGPLILNPGSVGCPSYDDPGAEPHVSEGGSPHARYAVLDITKDQVSADMIAITYDCKNRRLHGLKATTDPTGRMACGRDGSSPARGHVDVRPVRSRAIPQPQSPFEDQAGGCAMNEQAPRAIRDTPFRSPYPAATTDDGSNSLDRASFRRDRSDERNLELKGR